MLYLFLKNSSRYTMKNIKKTLLIFLIFNSCALFAIKAQSLQSSFKNLQSANGLIDTRVNCIYQDNKGFVWVGTGTTVERYDGTRFLTYSFGTSIEPAEHLVNAILETTPHDFWVGNINGLWKLDHNKNVPERMFPDKIDFLVQALAKDKNNHLYIGTSNGLYIYDNVSLKHILIEKNELSHRNQIQEIYVGEDGAVWLLTRDAVVFFDPKSGTTKTHRYHEDTTQSRFTCFTKVNNNLYIGTEKKGILSFNTQTKSFSPFFPENVMVSCLSSDNKNVLYIGLWGSGVRFLSLDDKKTIYTATYDPRIKGGLSSNMISSLLVDFNETIWVGSGYYTGLDYMTQHSNQIKVFEYQDFSSKDITVRSFLKHEDTTIIGTREGFYYISGEKNAVRKFGVNEKGCELLRSSLIFSLYRYKGKYLIGTYSGGLSVLDPVTMTIGDFESSGIFRTNDVFMFLEDENDNLWIPSSDGLHGYNCKSDEIKSYTPSNSDLPGSVVYNVLIDSQKRFWVCTIKGLRLFDPVAGTFQVDQIPGEFPIKEAVRSIYEDKDGNLFICLLDGKILFSNSTLTHYRYLFTSQSLNVYNIVQDNNGYYWLGTDIGVIRADRMLEEFVVLFLAEGMPDVVCAGSPCEKDENGFLWFGTGKGLVSIDPNEMPNTTPLIITGISINGTLTYSDLDHELQKNASPIIFNKEENNIGINFVSSGYDETVYSKYEYQLEGLTDAWTTLTGKSEVTFYDIPSGKYTFKVRRLLNNESVSTLSFVIQKGNYVWVYVLVVGLLIAIVVYVWIRKKTSVHKDKSMLKESSEEVTIKIQDEKYKYTKNE